jgi:ADP-ribose pyrophosphatase YjhB (NUDIX family)
VTSREHLLLHLAVDIVVMTVRENQLQVLVIERGHSPYAGQLALPGGFLRVGEDLQEAAERELAEETGLKRGQAHLEQLGVYGAPDRDPRGRVVSVAYLAVAPDLPIPTAGSDASNARWAPVGEVRECLVFDHPTILDDALERTRNRLEFTTLAAAFCDPTFTIGDLRHVYEVVWGRSVDPRNFSRKVRQTAGFVEPVGDKRLPATGRPAELYERGQAKWLNPPLMRIATPALSNGSAG